MLKRADIQSFIDRVDEYRSNFSKSQGFDSYVPEPLEVKMGRKWAKIMKPAYGPNNSVQWIWGFIALKNTELRNGNINEGDLLVPADNNRPSNVSRGNILDGTATFCHYGPCEKWFYEPELDTAKKIVKNFAK